MSGAFRRTALLERSLEDAAVAPPMLALQERVRVLEGRCRTLQQKWEESNGYVDELLRYVQECETARQQSNTLVAALVEENALLQESVLRLQRRLDLAETEQRSFLSRHGNGEGIEPSLIQHAPAGPSGPPAAGLPRTPPSPGGRRDRIVLSPSAAAALAGGLQGLQRTPQQQQQQRGPRADPTLTQLNKKLAALERAVRGDNSYSGH